MIEDDGPVFVSGFLGAGADYLCLLDPKLTPPVSWMGGKRRQAPDILALLELRPGHPIPAMLCDASWWGWVWPAILDEETGPRIAASLRGWRTEDPRELWFRLRDMGPITDDLAGAAAQLLWLQARAASGVPVWWESNGELLAAPGDGRDRQLAADRGLVSMDGHGRGPYPAWQSTGIPAAPKVDEAGQPSNTTRGANGKGSHGGPGRLSQWASTKVDEAGQRSATEPKLLVSDGRGDPRESGQRTTRQEQLIQRSRGDGPAYVASLAGENADRLVATTRGGQEPGKPFDAGHKGKKGSGGIIDPGTIANRLDEIRIRLVKASGGLAAPGKQDGWCKAKGWRVLQPGDIANRLDGIRAHVRGSVTIAHEDALTMAELWAPMLGARARVYLDPPYQGKTGYPATCSREKVLAIARLWARHGAWVVLSEAVPLADELGDGWVSVQLRHGKNPEWVTCYGCDVRAVLPPILQRLAQ